MKELLITFMSCDVSSANLRHVKTSVSLWQCVLSMAVKLVCQTSGSFYWLHFRLQTYITIKLWKTRLWGMLQRYNNLKNNSDNNRIEKNKFWIIKNTILVLLVHFYQLRLLSRARDKHPTQMTPEFASNSEY